MEPGQGDRTGQWRVGGPGEHDNQFGVGFETPDTVGPVFLHGDQSGFEDGDIQEI